MKVVLIAQVTRSGSRERGFLGSPPTLFIPLLTPRKLPFEGSPNLLAPVPCICGFHPLFRLLPFSFFLIVRLRAVPHFSSGIVELFTRFARSTIPEEKCGTTRSLLDCKIFSIVSYVIFPLFLPGPTF